VGLKFILALILTAVTGMIAYLGGWPLRSAELTFLLLLFWGVIWATAGIWARFKRPRGTP
jgi:hypothetical protein